MLPADATPPPVRGPKAENDEHDEQQQETTWQQPIALLPGLDHGPMAGNSSRVSSGACAPATAMKASAFIDRWELL